MITEIGRRAPWRAGGTRPICSSFVLSWRARLGTKPSRDLRESPERPLREIPPDSLVECRHGPWTGSWPGAIASWTGASSVGERDRASVPGQRRDPDLPEGGGAPPLPREDRKSTRLNSSHV